MSLQIRRRRLDILVLLALLVTTSLVILSTSAIGETTPQKPIPLVIDLNMNSTTYQEVLGGPPKSVSMESGLVTLAVSKSGEKHSTKKYEEVLVVFSGTGEMRVTGRSALNLKPNVVAYCPPKTEHYIINTGSEPLRYLYVAAKPLP